MLTALDLLRNNERTPLSSGFTYKKPTVTKKTKGSIPVTVGVYAVKSAWTTRKKKK
jgi:hypothetical protein